MRPLGMDGTKTPPGPVHRPAACRARCAHRLPVGDRGRAQVVWVAGVAVVGGLPASLRRPARSRSLTARVLDSTRAHVRARVQIVDSRDAVNDPAIGEMLVDAEELQRRVARARRRDQPRLRGPRPGDDRRAQGRGAVHRRPDARSSTVPCEIDFMAVSSYGSATDSSGVVRILKDLDASIEGRDVLIVEDIVDSGLTLHYLLRNLRARNPALARGLRAAHQAGAPPRRPADPLRRVRDPEPVRDRLRPRPRTALPQPALRGCVAGSRPRRLARRAKHPGTLIPARATVDRDPLCSSTDSR